MDKAVEAYRKRRQRRLDARFRKDAPEAENENTGGNAPAPRRGHGNTRLPFGLCQREGIEVGSDWTPRDAWEALAGKGITPSTEFAKRKTGGKTTMTMESGTTYRNLYGEKTRGGEYVLRGDFDTTTLYGTPKVWTKAAIHSFLTKDEMFACLKEYGVSSFKDPDTGKTVHPSKMEGLPRTVAKVGERRYTDLVLGTRVERTGHPFSGRGFSITGKDFTGKRTVLKMFSSIKEAKAYATKIGCKPEDLRLSPDFKRYATPKAG